jgi:DNA polymerase-3 subunit delta
MQLSAQQLGPHLARGLKSLYVLHGDDPLLQQESLDQIRAAARAQGFGERTSHTVMGAHFDWSAVLSASQSMSLFSDKQITEIRIPSGKPGKEGSTSLQQLAESSAGDEGNLTIVMLPHLDKASKSSAWFMALEGQGVSIAVEPMERSALPQWLATRLAAVGLRVESGEQGQHTLQFFADRVEGNSLAAAQEIQKLALRYPPTTENGGVLSAEQVETAVLNVARYDVFKLSDAVLSGHRQRVQRMLDGLRAEGEAEVLVHYTLAEDIRALKRVKDATAQGRPLPLALKEQRIWGNRERHFARVLPRLSEPALADLLQSAHHVDGIVKGLKRPDWPLDGWQALQRLALQLCALCDASTPQTAPRGKMPA